ncbi:MAG: hypothetical protein RIC55_11870 [Pirellulaceae bacterium]
MSFYHRALRLIAVALALINLVTCLALDQREWLVYFDPMIILVVVFPAFVIALPALPFLRPLGRGDSPVVDQLWLAFITLMLLGLEAFWFLMIALGTFCRDPNMTFYWPWEPRVAKLVPLNSFNLSEWIWILQFERPTPENPLIREAFGLLLLAMYLFVAPLAAAWLSGIREIASFWRACACWGCIQLLTLILLKVFLCWSVNLKYLVAFPEWFLNI